MKIGIDIRVLSSIRTGIGRLVKELLYGLAAIDKGNQYILFYNTMKEELPPDIPRQENFKPVTVRLSNRALNIFWAYTTYPKVETFTGPLDIFHGPSFQMPPTKRAANVLTIHDLVFLLHPEMAIPASVRHFRPRIREYARRADIIVADSQSTAADIARHVGTSPDKIATVYPGANIIPRANDFEIQKTKKQYGIDGDFILFVGSIEPRKNLVRLLRAYNYSQLSGDFQLVLVGPKGWRYKEIFETWKSLSCRNRICWLDYVSDEDLSALYSGASFLAYPSIMEGFGFPILEAMSVGCPVLTSNLSSMPEVAGDAALYVDPMEIESIADGIKRLSNDTELRDNLTKEGYKRVAMFTWEKTARQMLCVYQKACEIGKERYNTR